VTLPFRIAALLALVALPLAAAAFTPVAQAGDALAAPPLVDMNGRAVETRHGETIIAFIYTRCPDPQMCPLVTAKFARLARLTAGTPIRLLEVTLDPGYDTPQVLRRYGRAAGADGVRWTLATGQPEALAAFAGRAGLYVDRPRPGLVLHTEAVLIARDGIVEANVPGNAWSADEIAAEARAIAQLPTNPLQRLALRAFGGLAELCGHVGVGGITPAATLAIFVALLAASLFASRRLLHQILTGK
jgi:cytochrome oxidase Cu insertion factor (SCO1/SenC/PrrC family)